VVPTEAAPTDITDAGPTPPVLLDGLGALSGRTVRAIYWVFASLVAVVPAAVALLRLPDVASFFVLQVHYCVVAALAVAVLGIQAARSAGMERIVWAHLSAMAGLLLASQLQHTVRALVTGVLAPDIVVASALGVSALLVFVSMYARVARLRHATAFSRLRLGVDTVLIAFIGSTMGYQFVWRPWFDTVGIHDTTVRVVASIQPVIGLALIVGTLINIVGPRPSRWRSWESMLVLAFALFGANLSLWPGSYLSEYRGTEVVVAEVLVGSLGVLGMAGLLGAALYRLTDRGGRWNVGPLPGVKPSSGWLSTLGLPAFELLAIPVFGVLATSSEGPMQRMYSMSVMVVVASLILRTALTTADNGDLSRRSVTDALTGLENHRGFQERLAAAVSGAERFGETCCLTVLDLDDFAAVNETSGHASGDLMLVEVANVMRERVRESDVVCRIGGDEMAILFPVTPLSEAVAVSERVLEGLRIMIGPHGRALTASTAAATVLTASNRIPSGRARRRSSESSAVTTSESKTTTLSLP
jgi:diguanylate cyclase (GGDEF)-like protein